MNPELDNVSTHYNASSRRSFFFSRFAIIGSLSFLVISLIINVSVLNAQKTPANNLQSQAANEAPNVASLPKLPSGCEYKPLLKGFTVVCQKPSSSLSPSVSPIPLPSLPPQCRYELANGGYVVQCSPTTYGQIITIPLPILPQGCTYEASGRGYSLSCPK